MTKQQTGFFTRGILIPLFIIILLSSLVLADENHNPFLDYELSGTWSSITDESSTFRATSTASTGSHPLIKDIDNDGVIETVIADDDTVRIYKGSTLLNLSGETVNDTVQHMILHDIDSDGDDEIITVGQDFFSVLEYINNSLDLGSYVNMGTVDNHPKPQIEVGCYDDYCIIVRGEYESASAQNIEVDVVNATSFIDNNELHLGASNGDWMLPQIRHVEVVYDTEDNRAEFVFSAYEWPNPNLHLWSVYYNGSTVELDDHYEVAGNVYGYFSFSPPLVYDFDGGSDGYEVVVATMTTDDDFEFRILDDDLSLISTESIAVFDEGELVSNVVRMNAFPDTGSTDFCALGHDIAGDELNLICHDIINDETDGLDIDTDYDITQYAIVNNVPNRRFANNIIVPVQVDSSTQDGTNLDEILTTYGIFSLDYDVLTGDDLVTEFSFATVGDGTIRDGGALFYDYDQATNSDIIYYNEDGLYVIDDGFQNTQCTIDKQRMNTGNPICNNTLQTIYRLDVTDINGDTVNCTVWETYVNGTVKSNLGQLTSAAGGGTLTWYYDADEYGVYNLIGNCSDDYHQTSVSETYQVEVSDADDCNDWGEDPYEDVIISDITDLEEVIDDTNADLQNSFSGFPIFGSIMGQVNVLFVFWLILMIAAVVSTYLKTESFAVAGSVGGGMFLLGTVIGLIPAYYLLVIGIMAATGVTLYMFFNRGG